MSAEDLQQRRTGLPVVPGLLWTGVGLAPVAALLVLVAGANNDLVRFAMLLAIIAVAFIGTSLVLRRDPEAVRDQFEELLFDELDVLRDDMREDITTAARATHKAFGDRMASLQDSVDSLRGEVENLRVRVERGVPSPRVSPAPPTTSAPVVAPHGVVRHTETVKVTRQTIVDQNDGSRGAGTVYGTNRVAPSPVVPAQRRPEQPAAQSSGADSGESWSERLLRERLAEDSRRGEPGHTGSHTYGGWRAPEPDNSGHVTGVHAGDRWASMRGDELRVGERRAAMHADGSGAELRVEDRWAAVRRDEARRPEAPWDVAESRWERDAGTDWSRQAHSDRYGQSPGDQTTSWPAPSRDWRGAQPALPAASSQPSASSWLEGWQAQPEPVSERARVRERDDGGHRRTGRAEPTGYDTGFDRGDERRR
jgi:hypothetical protein